MLVNTRKVIEKTIASNESGEAIIYVLFLDRGIEISGLYIIAMHKAVFIEIDARQRPKSSTSGV